MKKSYFSLGFFFALGLIVSTMILTGTYKETRSVNTITVKGYAEKAIVSDKANWTAKVQVIGVDLGGTVAQLKMNMDRVKSYLRNYGIAMDEIDIYPVNTRYQYETNQNGYNTNTIIGTIASQSIEVTSSDVEIIKNVSVDIASLIQEGIDIESYSPRYDFTGLNDMKMELLGIATENAYERAKVIAENGDSDVGTLKYASQGVFQITSSGSNEVSDYGIVDQSSINKLAKAVVTAEFAID